MFQAISAAPTRTLDEALHERGFLACPEALTMLQQVLAQLQALHDAGRAHRDIGPHTVRLDGTGEATLADPEPVHELGGDDNIDLETCPPELCSAESLRVPLDLEAARQVLAEAGCPFYPRRIDVYQAGALLCRTLTGRPVADFLRSLKVKSLVPLKLQPVLARALGFSEAERFTNAADFATAIASLANDEAPETPLHGSVVRMELVHEATGDKTPLPPAAPVLAETQPDLPFEQLGHYKILRRIGHGGMGDVYLGYEETLQRQVAIKVLPAELARNKDFVLRFRAEAAAIARLAHPHVVPIYFIGQQGEHHFFAMQYVEGESLDRLVAGRKKLEVADALAILEQCLAGLGAAHAAGLVHRDIKPSNILLDARTKRALVADFGLVKSGGGGPTIAGVVVGTVDYIAPEVVRGQTADARSDLYAIGVMAYLMLSGRLPFVADTPSVVMFQHAYETPKSLREAAPETPEALAALVTRLMTKDPAERHQSCQDVLADIQRIRAGEPLAVAAPPTRSEPASRIIRQPDLELLPSLPTEPWIPSTGGRRRMRDRAFFWLRSQATDSLDSWRGTVQQVDGALAEYEDRRDRLAELVGEARALAEELTAHAATLRAGAQGAARRAQLATGEAAVQVSHEKEQCERDALALEEQAAQQREELERMEPQLAQVNATLDRLRSQRDVLNARLRTAEARIVMEGGVRHPMNRRWPILAASIAFLVLGLPLFFAILPKNQQPTEAPASLSPIDAPSQVAATILPSSNIAANAGFPPLDPLWLETVRGLARPERVKMVARELKRRNPDLDENADVKFQPLDVGYLLQLPGDRVTDLTPVQALPEVTRLVCDGSAPGTGLLADLTPLQGLHLTYLAVGHTKVKDLRPLENSPLFSLSLQWTSVVDLNPLKNIPTLTSLIVGWTGVSDLTPLKDLRLTWLDCNTTRVVDLTPVKDMPLTWFSCANTRVADLGPLRGKKLVYLSAFQTAVSDLTVVQGMPLLQLGFGETPVTNLAILRGLKLTHLGCSGTAVKDLSFVEGMPLVHLTLLKTKVTDLTPLRGMKLQGLVLTGSPVADLSPLEGMPIRELDLRGIPATDLSPLRRAPLRRLYIDYRPERDRAFLQSFTSLALINDVPAGAVLGNVLKSPPAPVSPK